MCIRDRVLREPLALRQTAIHPDAGRLALVSAMLGKRYRADAPTLVKANVPVNFLLPQLADTDAEARAILLYLPLRAYLLAILRSDNHRTWLRNVTAQLAAYLGDLSTLTDAERAAALWLAQVNAFGDTLMRMPNARTLDAENFFAEPVGVDVYKRQDLVRDEPDPLHICLCLPRFPSRQMSPSASKSL